MEFQKTLQRHNIKPIAFIVNKPHSNVICEQVHQKIKSSLNTLLWGHPPGRIEDGNDIIDDDLTTAIYATQKGAHSTYNLSPGSL